MNTLVALLAAAVFAINMIPLGVEAAIPKAAESANDAVGVAADVPKPGRAKVVPGATLTTKRATTPAKSARVGEPEKKNKKSKDAKPAQKVVGRS
jgi:hypothetical protein